MGENFTNLSKQFEQELINEYVKSGKTQIDSIPALYKNMLDEIDREIKINYQKSIKNLHDTLRDRDFKSDILTSYKKITDDALQTLGIDSELTRTLVRETKRVDSMPSIPLNEAIELRKNINEILRNYDKSSSDLKKFRAKNHLEDMKNIIDSNIEKHVYNKASSGEIDTQVANKLLDDFRLANAEYANIKELLSDKFAKAINKGMNKKDLDSRLTIEQWKQRVLDTNWGDSVKGLKNTIFKNFHPRMQENTQVLLILRALDRNIHLNTDSTPINFTKILSDLEQLENMTLAPKVYPILDLFKSYANAYQFSLELAKPKSLEMMHGGGALSTTLTGRMQVFLINRLFKNLFSFIPYLGDNNAVLKSLSKAIKNLKYPSEITLETLNQLSKNDLERGIRPSNTPQPPYSNGNVNKNTNVSKTPQLSTNSGNVSNNSNGGSDSNVMRTSDSNTARDSHVSSYDSFSRHSEALAEESITQSKKEKLREYNTLKKYNVDNVDLFNQEQYKNFVNMILSGDIEKLKKAPNIAYIANLNNDLVKALGLENGKIFLRKNNLHHFRIIRKARYNQSLREEEIEKLPNILQTKKEALIDTKSEKIALYFTDERDSTKINFVYINKDKIGNYVVTTKKTNKLELRQSRYKAVRVGVEPTTPSVHEMPITTTTASLTALNNSTQKKLTNTGKISQIDEKELQKVIKGENTDPILTEQKRQDLITLASDENLLKLDNQHRYNEQVLHKQVEINKFKKELQDEIIDAEIVATL